MSQYSPQPHKVRQSGDKILLNPNSLPFHLSRPLTSRTVHETERDWQSRWRILAAGIYIYTRASCFLICYYSIRGTLEHRSIYEQARPALGE